MSTAPFRSHLFNTASRHRHLPVLPSSANEPTVDPNLRGGYLAFAPQDSADTRHLKKLSAAGLTHVHLLPSFRFADQVDDNKEKWKFVDLRVSIDEMKDVKEV